MSENTINVTIKISGQSESFEFTLNTSYTVEQTIENILDVKTDLNKENITLVRKGRILKSKQLIGEIGIKSGETLHLVNKATSESKEEDANKQESTGTEEPQQQDPFSMFSGMGGMGGMFGMPGAGGMFGMPGMGAGGMPGMGGAPSQMPFGFNPEMIANIMQNPMVQSMMNDLFSDPDKLKGVFDSNPMLAQMAEGNEHIQELMNDPEKLKDAFKPEKMNEALKDMQNQMSGTHSHEDGKDEDSDDEQPQLDSGEMTDDQFNDMMKKMMGGSNANPSGMNMPIGLESMMSGFDPEMLNKMMSGFNLTGASTKSSSDSKASNSYDGISDDALKSQFSEQLSYMSSMGFTDEKSNIDMLKETGGDADKAIEKALEKMGSN